MQPSSLSPSSSLWPFSLTYWEVERTYRDVCCFGLRQDVCCFGLRQDVCSSAGMHAGIDTYKEVVDEAVILDTISFLLPSPALAPPPCR